jgi:hypothetical protein
VSAQVPGEPKWRFEACDSTAAAASAALAPHGRPERHGLRARKGWCHKATFERRGARDAPDVHGFARPAEPKPGRMPGGDTGRPADCRSLTPLTPVTRMPCLSDVHTAPHGHCAAALGPPRPRPVRLAMCHGPAAVAKLRACCRKSAWPASPTTSREWWTGRV